MKSRLISAVALVVTTFSQSGFSLSSLSTSPFPSLGRNSLTIQIPRPSYYDAKIIGRKMPATTTTTSSSSRTNPVTTTRLSASAAESEPTPISGMSPKLDWLLFVTYFSNVIAVTLPVVLLPVIAAELVPTAALSAGGSAAFIASVASISTLGGGMGKLVNGFVCMGLGGRLSASSYLIGLATFSSLLSFTTNPEMLGWILCGMEFCASIQWTACSVILANHYAAKDKLKFAAGITTLSLSSTAGVLLAKTGGTALLQTMGGNWRLVARMGSVLASMGAVVVRTMVSEYPTDDEDGGDDDGSSGTQKGPTESSLSFQTIAESFKRVLGSKLFWLVGLAHATTFLARTSDRILGAFYYEMSQLPRGVCGGLTASVTLGFVHGLQKARTFYQLGSNEEKKTFLRKNYLSAVVSTLGLALCGNTRLTTGLFGSTTAGAMTAKWLVAGLIAVCSGKMASSLSFQFYQIPPLVAALFGKEKAVCLSFLDGMGFFLSAPVWAVTGQIVSRLGPYGWSTAFGMVAALFGAGGALMLKNIDKVLEEELPQTQDQ
jgi:hypothetical protein